MTQKVVDDNQTQGQYLYAVGEDTFVGRGKTPALAIAAAALRAKGPGHE